MVIIDALISDDAIAAEVKGIEERILSKGGEMVRRDDWGKRKLAYPINRRTHGYYSIFYYKSTDRKLVEDLENGFRHDGNLVRWLTLVDHPMTDKVYGAEEELPPVDSDDEREERD